MVLVSGSDLVKTISNVLHLTKSIDIFDVEDRAADYLSQQCPSVTVVPDTVKQMDTDKKVNI